MKRTLVFVLVVISVSIAAPALAYAQELLPLSDMAAPVGMVTFGLLGLAGAALGFVLRRRSNRQTD